MSIKDIIMKVSLMIVFISYLELSDKYVLTLGILENDKQKLIKISH